MAAASSYEGAILGMGNPLLDISAVVPVEMFEKYGVTLNNAILAEDKHLPLYAELVEKFPVEYIAGGATQNSIRVAQWVSGRPGLTVYAGCIGDDEYGRHLEEAAAKDHVRVEYLKDPTQATGTCAVLIHEKERSLVANLAAANHYKIGHLNSAVMQEVVAKAKIFYSAGFFLTVSPESMVAVGKHAAETGKLYCTNLSAPFLPKFFAAAMSSVLPYADYVFGNESEALAWGEANGFPTATVPEIALKIAALPKASGTHARTVVITQGADPVVVALDGKATLYPNPPIPAEDLVDFNGAGDAFVGGYLAALVEGQDVPKAVAAGQWAAHQIIKRSGCTFPATPSGYFA